MHAGRLGLVEMTDVNGDGRCVGISPAGLLGGGG